MRLYSQDIFIIGNTYVISKYKYPSLPFEDQEMFKGTMSFRRIANFFFFADVLQVSSL